MKGKRLDDKFLMLVLVLQLCTVMMLWQSTQSVFPFDTAPFALLATIVVIYLSYRGHISWRIQYDHRIRQMEGHIDAFESSTDEANKLVILHFKETAQSLDQVCRIVEDTSVQLHKLIIVLCSCAPFTSRFLHTNVASFLL